MTSATPTVKVLTLDELFSYQDERFIHYAYLTILGRYPDSEGMLYYLTRIRSGIKKIEILAQLRLSKEGSGRPANIIGLDEKIRKYYWLQLPIIGAVLKIFSPKTKLRNMLTAAIDESKNEVEASSKQFENGRGKLEFSLEPVHQLEPDTSNKQNNWVSQGEDPYFHLIFDEGSSPSEGWYNLDLCILVDGKKGISKLYLDTGSGFNELETVVLSYVSDEPIQRVFFAKKPILAIRFDPNDKKGMFGVNIFGLTSISESVALSAMFTHLASSHPAYEGMRPEDVATATAAVSLLNVKPLATVVHNAYASTFHRQAIIEYAEWIEQIEAPDLPTQDEVVRAIEAMKETPLISIIMPTYNTPEAYLRACIESVKSQSYPYWELCVADDASPQPHVRGILKEYQQFDKRIRTVFRRENGHISQCSNSALELAHGEFVALLDHDDVLPQHALYFVALTLNKIPDAQIVYSDEDKIDAHGVRLEPHFKSDWNPDLFFSQNYVSHLGVYKRELLTRIGGFRTGVEGSQDQDLLLRCLPYTTDAQIVHIPKILYHWRAAEGSTALGSSEKNYTTQAGIKALEDYFTNNGPKGVTISEGVVPNTYRVRYPIPVAAPLVSLLIPTRDRLNLIETCVRSILEKTTYRNFEILILDNGSRELDTMRFLKQIVKDDSRVRVLRYDHPFNYSAINNYGVEQANGSVIGLVNNDIKVINPDWLREMVSHVCRFEIGCVGAKLYYENDTIQHAGVICGLGGVAGHIHREFPRTHPGYFARLVTIQALSVVTAACLLIRRKVYDEVNGLDEVNLKIAFNDVDLCLKVRAAGFRNIWTPYAELYHYESISRGTEDTPEKQARFLSEVLFMKNKWKAALELDPFYNKNLTRDRHDFSLREI
jgi:O-antigen biosynthesis protein